MTKSPSRPSRFSMLFVGTLAAGFLTAIQPPSALALDDDDLTALSLEALMDIKVTSVSRKPQKLADAAAAAFVISQEEIHRSGATTIPELLRMVPGVQVARIDANKWAVSIRGFNGRFANKLLVLKDGRSLYTPLFSGVYWEQQETLLEDIERIEVIRGPGAALWGANAVNGVINIITKAAKDTPGGLARAGGGSTERDFGSLRYGYHLGQDTDLRLYGGVANRGPNRTPANDDAHDSWQTGTAGFRLDNEQAGKDSLTLQGDYSSGAFDENYTLYKLPTAIDPSFTWRQNSTAKSDSANLLSRWQRSLSGTDSLSLQCYYDHYRRDMLVLDESHDTVDFDFQHRFQVGSRQDMLWGVGYRYSHDQLTNSPYIIFAESDKGTSLLSAFLHDEISLIADKLSLILGIRSEHNDYSGFEWQPNARLLWTPTTHHSFWAALSRAARTPSRGDQDIQYRFLSQPGNPPIRLEIDGSPNFTSETVLATELGYRTSPTPRTSMDIALFLNQYDKLRIPQPGLPFAEPVGVFPPANYVQPYLLTNSMHGQTYGAELSTTWTPYDGCHLQAAYTFLYAGMFLEGSNNDMLAEINRNDAGAGAPRHQGSLRSGFDLGRELTLDLWWRAVARVDYIDQVSIPGYLTMDARLAWKPIPAVELSLVGQNLFPNRHPEYIPEFINTTASELPRSVYGMVTWKF